MKKFKILSLILSSIFLTTGLYGCKTKENTAPSNPTQNTTKNTTSQSDVSPVTTASEKVIPSVVGIVSKSVVQEGFRREAVEGVGSGMIIDSDGYILTNNHVAPTNSSLKIGLYNGKDTDGKTIWANEGLDLAIVKINEKNLTPVQLADSSKVRIGESVIAIGNPLGLKFQRTVTAGIISALNRTIEISDGVFMEDLLQTDASINPGNSGGPLLNLTGDVIGVNSAKIKSAEGIGFAVPVNIVKPVIKKLKEKGKFETPVIGIVGFDKEMAESLNVNLDKGIYIYKVSSGGGAEESGLKKGDIILSIDGKEVKNMNDLREILYNTEIGKTIKIKAKTASGEKDFDVKIKTTS